MTDPITAKPSRISAMLRSRCPVCLTGHAFASFLTMHKSCPNCGTVFEREHGYFLNAIFVGYLLNGIVLAPLVLYGIFTGRLEQTLWAVIAVVVLLAAPTFRYARVIWMHMDQVMDPRDHAEK